MIDLQNYSPEELRELADLITLETDRRERIRVELEFIGERVAALERIAGERAEQTYEPGVEYLPGQVVAFARRRWVNTSGRVTTVQPGKNMPIWEPIPEPTEPEPTEPDPA